MPNARGSKALALLLVWLMVAAVFVVASTASARPTESVAAPTDGPTSRSLDVSPDGSSLSTPSYSDLLNAGLAKIDEDLQEIAKNPSDGASVDVVFHTTNVPMLATVLERIGARSSAVLDGQLRTGGYVARPWGAVGVPTPIRVQIPEVALVNLAVLPYVEYVEPVAFRATTQTADPALVEAQDGLAMLKARLKAGIKQPDGPGILGTDAGVSPTSWGIAREHKAWDAWNLNVGGVNIEGQGVNVAVIDTGEDFGHPSLNNRWAVEQNPLSPWYGWPIMFHPASMLGLMGPGFLWTQASDFDRLPLPFWLSANDGDSWYSNTDYVANDTNLDGYLVFQDLTTNPLSLLPQRTSRENPQQLGNFNATTYSSRMNRNYWVGCAGQPGPCIPSASGYYRLGVNRDDTLTGLWGKKVGLLLVDSTTPFMYDTVYVDLNFDLNFTNDKPVTQASPLAVADLTGDGIVDISGGLLYFIASSSQQSELVIGSTTGTETGVDLAKWVDFTGDGAPDGTSAAVNISGWFTWDGPAHLWLNDGITNTYLPSATEDIYEDLTVVSGSVLGATWPLGSDLSNPAEQASRTPPANIINGRAVNSARLLRGPGTDFSVSMIYDISDDAGLITPGTLDTNWGWNADAGTITFFTDLPPGDTVYIIYQLATYTLEPASGRVTFQDPQDATAVVRLPAGWSLSADYEVGLPIPYSQVWGPAHGYDTFIPANGQLVAFHGEFDEQSHGSFVTSTVAAHPFGNLVAPVLEVFGTAPQARVIGIAACCNVPGPVGLFGSIEDQRTFAAVGYDGLPNTGDEGVIMSNSFGDPGSRITGFSFEDRWLIDFWNRYPNITPLIALGNNGPGYGTNAPGGSSPGVIGVGAGTSGDYRWLYGNDLGDAYWELPLCPPAPPPPAEIDPKDCVGTGAASGSGPGPYGDIIFFSSRGPTLMGTPKPDIVSIGGYAVEAGPLNVFGGVPADLDGNFAFDIFSGTSQATPVTAGVSALIAQAYKIAHGTFPTNVQLKELLKSGADDAHRDILQQGAGWTNALRSVQAALDGDPQGDGITASPDAWVPGTYNGVRRVGFVNFVNAGASDATTITVTNHNPLMAKTVNVRAQVYERMAAPILYSFSLATGSNQWVIAKADGVYDRDGAVNVGGPGVDFTAYWNTADFVKVTLAYDATVYTAGTSLRLDTFDWYDSNLNGLFDQDSTNCRGTPVHGCYERNRMTVDAPGGGANSVWDTIHSPGARIHDGWALNPRSGAGAAIPATLIFEFYERAPWPWITVPGSVLVAGNNFATIPATVNVPGSAPPGMYQGGIYLEDTTTGDITTIPVVITVPVSQFPVLLGGSPPTTSLYDNNGVVQGTRASGWIQIGDSRYVWANISVASAPGRKMIYNAILQGPRSDPEMFVFSCVPDPDGFTDDATYGPCTMNPLSGTRNVPGSTTTLYPNREIMFSEPISGLIAFQVKSWGSMAETEQLEANIGIMQVTPDTINIATNKVFGQKFFSTWADVPLYDGLATANTQTIKTTLTNQVVNQDNPNDRCTASYVYRLDLLGVIALVITVDGDPPNDIDLFLMRDNGNSVYNCAEEILLASSTSPTADEQVGLNFPPDGIYWVAVHGWSVPGGSTTFTHTIDVTQTGGTSNFSCVCPTTTIPPNTPSGGYLQWDFPGDLAEGSQNGFLFLSPGYAPYALVQLLTINLRYDLTAPVTDPSRELTPAPNSVITQPAATVVATVRDAEATATRAGELDRFSIQLIVDGEDVTSQSKVIAIYSTATAPAPIGYNEITIAWDHATAPFGDGPHSAIVNVRDYAGNPMTAVWRWTVDTTPPDLSISDPSTDAMTNQATWDFVAQTDPGSTVTLAVNGVPAAFAMSPEGVVTATLVLISGDNDIVMTSADALGNTATATRTVTLDTTSPVITANADVLTPTNRLSTTVRGTVTKAVSAVSVNNEVVAVAADGTFTTVVNLAEGPNAIVITTTDAAGNTATTSLGPIVRDTVAPTITASLTDATGQPVTGPVTDLAKGEVIVSGSVPDADVFFVTVNGRAVGLTGGRYSVRLPLGVGDNVFIVQAEDDAGNVARTQVSAAYAPVQVQSVANYNSVIASGVAVVLLIVGFVVGYLLSGRGGGPEPAAPKEAREEAPAEEELPRAEPEQPHEEEEL